MKLFICDKCNEKIEPESPCKVKIKQGNYVHKYTYCKTCANNVKRLISPYKFTWENIDVIDNKAQCPVCGKINMFYANYCKWCGNYNFTPIGTDNIKIGD